MISRKRRYKKDKLKALRKKFEHWRAERRGGEPIPEELWKAAGELIGPMPCSRVADELGLDAGKLRKKVRDRPVVRRSAKRAQAKPTASAFVELIAPSSANRGSATGVVGAAVELERSDGLCLRLSGDAIRGLDLVALVERFSAAGIRE